MPIELSPGPVYFASSDIQAEAWSHLNATIINEEWNSCNTDSSGLSNITNREDRHNRTNCAWKRVFFAYRSDRSSGNEGIYIVKLNWLERVIRVLFGWAGAYSNTIFTKESLNRIWAAIKLSKVAPAQSSPSPSSPAPTHTAPLVVNAPLSVTPVRNPRPFDVATTPFNFGPTPTMPATATPPGGPSIGTPAEPPATPALAVTAPRVMEELKISDGGTLYHVNPPAAAAPNPVVGREHRQNWTSNYAWPAVIREIESTKLYFLGYYPSKEAVEHGQNAAVRKFQAKNKQINKLASKQQTQAEAEKFAADSLTTGFANYMPYENPYAA